MTVPYWRRVGVPERLVADAVVVGGGIVGLSAALELARRGLKVRLLERGRVGSGASTRNAGFLMRGCADHYADAARLYGRSRARELWAFTEENLRELRREGVEALASYARRGSCLVALDEGQAAELEAAHGMMVEDGLESRWITRRECDDAVFASGAAVGGLVNPGDPVVNPAELVGMLAAKVRAAGVSVHEGAEVCGIEESGSGAEVATGSLRVRAGWVVVCTNAYGAGVVPGMEKIVTPRRGQMLAMEAAGRRLDFAYYANHGSEYFRSAGDGTIVVGGCRTYFAEREIGTEDVTTEYVQSALEAFARRVLGEPVRVTARWAGIMGFTPDGLPAVGVVPGFGARVWGVVACTGHGMSMGFLTAKKAVGEMMGGEGTGFGMGRFG